MDQARLPKRALVDNRQFQIALDAIPKPNAGYVYLDWTASKTILERQPQFLSSLKWLPFSITAIADWLVVTAADRITQSGIFFQ